MPNLGGRIPSKSRHRQPHQSSLVPAEQGSLRFTHPRAWQYAKLLSAGARTGAWFAAKNHCGRESRAEMTLFYSLCLSAPLRQNRTSQPLRKAIHQWLLPLSTPPISAPESADSETCTSVPSHRDAESRSHRSHPCRLPHPSSAPRSRKFSDSCPGTRSGTCSSHCA